MTADLLSREWPLAPMLGTFTHESTHVQNFLLALFVRIQILRTVCTDEIARKLPRNGCKFLLVAFYQCNCDFASIWLDRKVPRCLVNISGGLWIYFWVRITFEWVDWVKEISLLLRTCTSHPVEDLNKRKRGGKREFTHPMWSLVLEYWYLPA